jgi:probable HAF family extracellular repeat protein
MNPRRAVCFLAVVLIVPAPLALGQVTYTEIDYPGSVGTGVTGINSAGDMVGEYQTVVGGANHGFVLSQGRFTSFDYPGAVYTYPNGINDLGQIVGDACTTQCGFPYLFSFLYDGQNFTQIIYPGVPGTEGNGINNAGEVVGRIDGFRSSQAFKFRDGQFTAIMVPGRSPDEDALGINNLGEIVGGRYKYPAWHSWADQNGIFDFLDIGTQSVAFGLNDNGVVVGWWFDGSGYTGFAWSKGKYISLSYPGADSTTAIGINNSGQVVGSYSPTLGSENHGFVTSPITDANFEAAEDAR